MFCDFKNLAVGFLWSLGLECSPPEICFLLIIFSMSSLENVISIPKFMWLQDGNEEFYGKMCFPHRTQS